VQRHEFSAAGARVASRRRRVTRRDLSSPKATRYDRCSIPRGPSSIYGVLPELRKTGHRTGEQVPRVRAGIRASSEGRALQGHHDDDAGERAAGGGRSACDRRASGCTRATTGSTRRDTGDPGRPCDDAGAEQGRESDHARNGRHGHRSPACTARPRTRGRAASAAACCGHGPAARFIDGAGEHQSTTGSITGTRHTGNSRRGDRGRRPFRRRDPTRRLAAISGWRSDGSIADGPARPTHDAATRRLGILGAARRRAGRGRLHRDAGDRRGRLLRGPLHGPHPVISASRSRTPSSR
jgi:hypothetical protein